MLQYQANLEKIIEGLEAMHRDIYQRIETVEEWCKHLENRLNEM